MLPILITLALLFSTYPDASSQPAPNPRVQFVEVHQDGSTFVYRCEDDECNLVASY